MTFFEILRKKLVKVNIPDDIIKIIFDYTKCKCINCHKFGNLNHYHYNYHYHYHYH